MNKQFFDDFWAFIKQHTSYGFIISYSNVNVEYTHFSYLDREKKELTNKQLKEKYKEFLLK